MTDLLESFGLMAFALAWFTMVVAMGVIILSGSWQIGDHDDDGNGAGDV